MLHVQIDLSSAAFDDNCAQEIARILHDLAARIEHGRDSGLDRGRLFDVNGNAVGDWEWTH